MCFPQIKSVQILLMTNDQRFHQQIANVFPYISVTHGFANEIQFSVFIHFDPSLRNLASSWHQGKLIWITGNNCFRVQFILCRAFGFAHHWRRLFSLFLLSLGLCTTGKYLDKCFENVIEMMTFVEYLLLTRPCLSCFLKMIFHIYTKGDLTKFVFFFQEQLMGSFSWHFRFFFARYVAFYCKTRAHIIQEGPVPDFKLIITLPEFAKKKFVG